MKQPATNFNTWFDETTLRLQKLSIMVATIASLMTALLFLQTVMKKEKSLPVQQVSQQQAPNIIFLVADAISASDMSIFGYSLPTTPNLNKITQNWTVFSNAQSPLTCTVAALPTFVTGRYTYLNDFAAYGDWTNANSGWLSLPQALEKADYQNWWSGYLTPGYYHMGSQFDKNACRIENDLYVTLSRSRFLFRSISKSSFPFIPFLLDRSEIIKTGQKDFDRCDELDSLDVLLQEPTVEPPFFVFYHYRGAHGFPYPSGESLGAFLPESEDLITEIDQRKVYGSYKPGDQGTVDQLRLRYDEAILDQDQKLADFIESLKMQGLYDSSMIILVSDHGQSFNNGYTSHCTPLVSNAEARVPLLIKYPYQTQGQWYDFLVSTIDIAPTILDVAGLEYPEDWFDGISLLKQAAKPNLNRIVFTRRYMYYNSIPAEIAATDGKYRLVMRGDDIFLFDIIIDPLEKVNLLEQDGFKQMPELLRLQQGLENYRQRARWLQAGNEILTAPLLTP